VTPVDVIAASAKDDLGLVKASVASVPSVARFRVARDAEIGEHVFVFGYPLHGLITSTGSLTTGIVSALAGLGDNYRQLQISAPIQPGNSGGPITDAQGQVIGVVVSKLNESYLLDQRQTIPQNVNFGIKGSVARGFLQANGVEYQRDGYSEGSKAAKLVREFTVMLRCYQ
jgi:S1-C subfamily serine protease